MELGPCLRVTEAAAHTCFSGILAGIFYHCALIFPTVGQESQAYSVECLEVYCSAVLSDFRSTCETHKDRQQLECHMYFSTPKL